MKYSTPETSTFAFPVKILTYLYEFLQKKNENYSHTDLHSYDGVLYCPEVYSTKKRNRKYHYSSERKYH